MTAKSKKPVKAGPPREELLGRAWDLLPDLRERAPRAETDRRMPDATEREFHRTGLFRMIQPARVGGSELELGFLVEVGSVIGRACASSAWSLINLGCHHWMLAMFPPAAQEELWDISLDILIASSLIFPAGRAKPVKGGYELSGRWPFSSGIDNSTWCMLAGMVHDGDSGKPPEARLFLIPDSDYRVIDTWDAAGLCATGSHDVEAKEIFVPAHRTLAARDMRGQPTPGSAVNPGPLYRLPLIAIAPYVISGVSLGIALGAWEGHVETLRDRISHYTGARVADFQAVQIKLATARSMIDAAELIMLSHCRDAMRIARAGQVPDIGTKTRYRSDGAFSVKLCTDATDIIFGLSGGAGLYQSSPLQRAFRDAHAANAHALFNLDAAGTMFGRAALGLPVDNPML